MHEMEIMSSLRPNRILKLVNMVLIRLLSDEFSVKLLGGIWTIKQKTVTIENTPIRNLFIGIYYAYLAKYCCYIGSTAIFENKPILPHGFFGIFISQHAIIGTDCVIFPHVVVGSNRLADSKNKGSPTIGNNVFIGAGAIIIGNVRIGNNCRIGSNCTVTHDIPDNSLVVMEQPRIIDKKNMNNRHYTPYGEGFWRYTQNGVKIIETDEKWLNNLHEIDSEWVKKKQ